MSYYRRHPLSNMSLSAISVRRATLTEALTPWAHGEASTAYCCKFILQKVLSLEASTRARGCFGTAVIQCYCNEMRPAWLQKTGVTAIV